MFFHGIGGIGVTLFFMLLGLALAVGRRMATFQSRVVLGLALVTSCIWLVRSSWWILLPATLAIAGMLLLAASLSRKPTLFDATWFGIGQQTVRLFGHLALALPWLGFGVRQGLPVSSKRRWLGFARALVIALPILTILGLLLASADPIFATALRPHVSGTAIAVRMILALSGATALAWLWRITAVKVAASAEPTEPRFLMNHGEAVAVLGGVAVLFAGFVGVQVASSMGMGSAALAERGVTVAEYARSGYFQLLVVVFLTVVVLIAVDASRATVTMSRRLERGLSLIIVALALAIVVVAMRRLAMYVDTYGLTMLRVSCLPGAVWMTSLLGLTAIWVAGLRRRHRWLPGASVAALFATMLGFALLNPEAAVVRYNVAHASTRTFDVAYLSSLSDDAVPALIDSLASLDPAQAVTLKGNLCQELRASGDWSSWSFVKSRADAELESLCNTFARTVDAQVEPGAVN